MFEGDGPEKAEKELAEPRKSFGPWGGSGIAWFFPMANVFLYFRFIWILRTRG